MTASQHPQPATPPWHALLAPLPDDAILRRQPVAPPEILATPEGASIAGWEQVTIDLSAGPAGLRNVLVVLDATGRPISASDAVLYHSEPMQEAGANGSPSPPAPDIEWRHESLGGRIEEDGSFLGTRWRSVGVEHPGEDEPRMNHEPSEPTAEEVAGLLALVAEVMRRLL